MTDSQQKKMAIEILVALCLGLLVSGLLSHASPASLDAGTYSQALRLMQKAPQGGGEMLAQWTFAVLSPLANLKNNAMGLVNFYLWAPLLLLILSSGLAYAALRLHRFGRLESAGVAALFLLSTPIAFAFYPGLWLPETMAIALALAGLVGLGYAARHPAEAHHAAHHAGAHATHAGAHEKKSNSTPMWAGYALALLGFGAAAWVLPMMAALPLSLLAGELAQSHRDLNSVLRVRGRALRLAVLLVPVLLALAFGLPAIGLDMGRFMAFLYETRFILGLALVSMAGLLALDEYPLSLTMAGASLVALLAGAINPAAGLVALLLPAAQGLRVLGTLAAQSLRNKALLLGAVLLVTALGFFALQADIAQLAGLSVMAALAGLAIAHVYGWPGGLLKWGLMAFLLCGAMLMAAQASPGVGTGGPYHYEPLPSGVQRALVWIGQNHGSEQPRVGAPISPDTAALLANASLVADNETWVKFLASSNSSRLLRRGDFVVAYPELLDTVKSDEWLLGRPWTLVSFKYVGTAQQNGQAIAIFYSSEGLILQQGLLDANTLSPGKPQVFSAYTGQAVSLPIYAGDIGLLDEGRRFDDPDNRLVWYQQEFNSNLMRLYRDNGTTYQTVYQNGTVRVLQVVGG